MLGFTKKKYRTLNTIKIFKEALLNNLNVYKELLPELEICPVLKANAYGHGLKEVAMTLEKSKPAFFIVDSLYEAYELQKAGIKTKILILGYSFPENLLRKRLPFHFALTEKSSIPIFRKLKVPVHVEIDTGMSRTGFPAGQIPDLSGLNVEGIFTHMADADNPTDLTATEEQEKEFIYAIETLKSRGINPKWIHTGGAGGAASFRGEPIGNMLRLGIALYGVSPLESRDPQAAKLKELKPALELHSTLVAIQKIKKGRPVSYNGTYIAPADMSVGVVPVGYYEGLPRSLSNKGFMEVHGKICPIIGRICMNYSMIDLSGVSAEIGDKVIVYSKNPDQKNSIQNLAGLAETIPYELLVRLSESIRREVT